MTDRPIAATAPIAEKEPNKKAYKWLIRGTVGLLTLFFVAGIVWGANDILLHEGKYPPEAAPDETITNPPATKAELYDYVRDAIALALSEKPKLNAETTFNLHDEAFMDSIAFTGENADWLTNIMKHTIPQFEDQLKKGEMNVETEYGDVLDAFLWHIQGDPNDLSDAANVFNYFRCSVCGNTEDAPQEICPNCGSENAYVEKFRDEYNIVLSFADGSDALFAHFPMRSNEERLAMLGDGLASFAKINAITVQYTNARIVANINRTTKKINSLQFIKDIRITAGIQPIAPLDYVGIADVSFTIQECNTFNFTWLHADICSDGNPAESKILSPKQASYLSLKIYAPEGTKITWASDRPEIVAIDADGYINAGAENGEAVISASFDFDGKTYTDTIQISVKTPTEGVKIDRRKLSMKTGETAQLKAEVSPSDATYQDVTWHSENPMIAEVDANGLVTAKNRGVVAIYCLTEDDYWRATCTITIEGDDSRGAN
ncbi:MAG: Ig-like domain-containing protein [Oscillospiraceae bacterium]|jgi:uncharacterized protein YjdB/rubrerythrin|nr:Ig-like domain-containing protein [Oscillospiraceae bacterium]